MKCCGNRIDAGAGESYIECDDNVTKDVTLSVDEAAKTIVFNGKSGIMYDNINCTLKLGVKVASIEAKGDAVVMYNVPDGVEDISISASGACVIEAKGACASGAYNISGASKLKAAELKADSVKAEVSGASIAEVFAKSSIDANASGTSTITYYGKPSKKQTNASGLSSVVEK